MSIVKSRILEILQRTPRLRRTDVILTVLPAIVWAVLAFARPTFISPRCVAIAPAIVGEPAPATPTTPPSPCAPESVNSFDRVALGLKDGHADGLSYATQNISGYLAFGVPVLWNAGRAVLHRVSPGIALVQTGTDLALLLQTSLWNGALTETVRHLVQRPRPFVYSDPVAEGGNPSHYVSFYSGHTSFSAAALTGLLLVLLSRGAGAALLLFSLAGAQGLIMATGIFRVLAGRHFPTDVMAGAAAGICVALLVALWHRREPPRAGGG